MASDTAAGPHWARLTWELTGTMELHRKVLVSLVELLGDAADELEGIEGSSGSRGSGNRYPALCFGSYDGAGSAVSATQPVVLSTCTACAPCCWEAA